MTRMASHGHSTLNVVTIGAWQFQVVPVPELETYVLREGGSNVAAHPDGYSLRNLVDRLAAYHAGNCDAARVKAQWDYIRACGGMIIGSEALAYYLERHPTPDEKREELRNEITNNGDC